MDQKDEQASFAEDLLRLHKVITRGLSLGNANGTEFLSEGFPNRDLQQGFSDYIRSLVSVLSAHHLGEDEIAFPSLKEKHVAAPYERLAANHKDIERLLGIVNKGIPDMAGAAPLAGLGVVVDGLRHMLEVWKPHIAVEEAYFSEEAITELMSRAEQAQLNASMTRHAQEHSGPPFLVLPFLLFNLAGADRAEMAATMPRQVVEEFIPKEWRERWATMQPFLLDQE